MVIDASMKNTTELEPVLLDRHDRKSLRLEGRRVLRFFPPQERRQLRRLADSLAFTEQESGRSNRLHRNGKRILQDALLAGVAAACAPIQAQRGNWGADVFSHYEPRAMEAVHEYLAGSDAATRLDKSTNQDTRHDLEDLFYSSASEPGEVEEHSQSADDAVSRRRAEAARKLRELVQTLGPRLRRRVEREIRWAMKHPAADIGALDERLGPTDVTRRVFRSRARKAAGLPPKGAF